LRARYGGETANATCGRAAYNLIKRVDEDHRQVLRHAHDLASVSALARFINIRRDFT
jgi:hypothetical protein